VPYVIKTAGDGSHTEFYSRHKFSRALKSVDQFIQKCVFENACCIDVVSGPQKDKLSFLYPSLSEHIHVIDNGVETAKFNPDNYPQAKKSLGFLDDDIVVGYVGSVPMQRGGKEVIDVVAALRSDNRVRGLVIGDSGEADACREYASKLDLSDLVVVYGEADYTKVPSLMAAIDCGMSIRRVKERSVAELKVRQYLASGACVVGTPVSNDFLRGCDFARVVESDEIDEIVAAVRDLIQNGQARLADLGKKARAFANTELSLTARNDLRLRYWTESIGSKQR
jgi:glycosyltransferase involved in cell wall biosynthesis